MRLLLPLVVVVVSVVGVDVVAGVMDVGGGSRCGG